MATRYSRNGGRHNYERKNFDTNKKKDGSKYKYGMENLENCFTFQVNIDNARYDCKDMRNHVNRRPLGKHMQYTTENENRIVSKSWEKNEQSAENHNKQDSIVYRSLDSHLKFRAYSTSEPPLYFFDNIEPYQDSTHIDQHADYSLEENDKELESLSLIYETSDRLLSNHAEKIQLAIIEQQRSATEKWLEQQTPEDRLRYLTRNKNFTQFQL